MLLIVSLMVILFITVIFTLFAFRFTLVRIHGNSMEPTFHDGQFKFVDRKYYKEHYNEFAPKGQKKTIYTLANLEDKVYVIITPDNVLAIKRLVSVAQTLQKPYFWFEGDNKDHSIDSRNYGFIEGESILGEVITAKQLLKRIWKPF
jgi:signal peptidase I